MEKQIETRTEGAGSPETGPASKSAQSPAALKPSGSLSRILARIRKIEGVGGKPSCAQFVAKNDSIFGIWTSGVVPEIDLLWDAIAKLQAGQPIASPESSTNTMPTPQEPNTVESNDNRDSAGGAQSLPIITDDEARQLKDYMVNHFRFPGQGQGRMIKDVMIVMGQMQQKIEAYNSFSKAMVSWLDSVYPGTMEQASDLDIANARAVVAHFVETRDQVHRAFEKVSQ